jgi:hypothetical protein
MDLVVRDLARDAADRGRLGRMALWGGVIADLAAAGLRERAVAAAAAPRPTLIRWSGLASVAGGAVFLTSMIVPLRGPLRAGVPGSVVGMAAGAVGLYLVLHGRRPGVERLGLLLAGAGLALGAIGMGGSALGVLDPNPLAPVINTGEHVGLVLIGAGMSVWGVLAVRTRALGPWSFAPALIGVCGLAGASLLAPAVFRVLEAGPLPLVFAAGWILTGLGLYRQGHPAAAVPR